MEFTSKFVKFLSNESDSRLGRYLNDFLEDATHTSDFCASSIKTIITPTRCALIEYLENIEIQGHNASCRGSCYEQLILIQIWLTAADATLSAQACSMTAETFPPAEEFSITNDAYKLGLTVDFRHFRDPGSFTPVIKFDALTMYPQITLSTFNVPGTPTRWRSKEGLDGERVNHACDAA